MAILQISKIQQRSGNLVDLPQLDDAEFGWANDAKRLFIGKTTPNENVEILTSYSQISFSQIDGAVGNLNISNLTVADGQILAFDGSSWVNRGGTVGGLITLGDVSNVKITGGAIGYILQTDGTGNLSWTPKGTLVADILNVTKANPAVVTTVNDNFFTNGGQVTIIDPQGMSELAGNIYYANLLTSTTFELFSDDGLTTPVDSSGYTAYSYTTVSATTVSTNVITVANSSPFTIGSPVKFIGNMSTSNISNTETYYVLSKPNGTSLKIATSDDANVSNVVPLQTTSGLTAEVYQINGQAISTINSGATFSPAGGTNTTVQFNDTGSLSGSPALTFDFGSNVLTLSGNAVLGNLAVNGVSTATRFISNVATGTAPLEVTSTTRVANLNVNYANVTDFSVVTNQTTGLFYPVFVSSSGTGNRALGANANISFNAATGNLTVTILEVTANIGANNIATNNQLTVGANANVTGNLNVSANANITANLNANNGAIGNLLTVGANANVTGNLNITANANVTGRLNVVGVSTFSANANVTGNLNVTANANITANVNANNVIAGNLISSSSLTVSGSANLASSTGNVGVGTTSPGAKLDVVGTSATDIFHVTAGTTYFTVGATNGTQVEVNSFQTGVGPKLLTLQSAGGDTNFGGNVGFGTATPGSKLDIISQDAVRITGFQPFYTLRDSNDANKGFRLQTANGNTLFSNDSSGAGTYTERMRIDTNGNVGIGNSAPTDTLSVTGNARISGNLTVAGNLNFTGAKANLGANGNVIITGGSGGQLLSTDGSGNLSWVSQGAIIGGAAGSNTQVQYNALGLLAASANFTFNYATNALAVGGNITSSNLVATSYHIRSITTGISAAGSTQLTATGLTKEINVVSTVSSGQGVVLPAAVAGMVLIVNNTSANTLNVYPALGGAVNSGATNAAYSHPAGASIQYYATSGTQWYTVGATFA